MIVTLKKLENSKNVELEFNNEICESYGITQNPETKYYMIVLNDKCKKCNCICCAIHFQRNFDNWASGNDYIDKFIQDTQLSAHGSNYDNDVFKDVLEWIPYDRFYNIKYIARGGFGKVYRANWIDGYIINWKSGFWNRHNENMFVALKSLDNSKNVTLEFMNEVAFHNKGKINNTFIIGFYGMTQDPETKNYMMVLDYAEDGSLRNYLDREYSKLNWDEKIEYMFDIITGLYRIHNKELIHRDLHIGNILKLKYRITITDMGLCKPANYIALENAKNNIYGVLPYIAPEILRGQNYTKAADIYSFGIIMYEVISGLPPYHDISHDENLAIKICRGLRPRFNIKVPQLIVHLIKRCLDANPLNRPMTGVIKDILREWQYIPVELKAQIEEADEFNNDNLPIDSVSLTNLGLSYEIHSEAIYTSRLLDFNDLPEPKNSDDYYNQNDNIISKKFSESLQIDISQLNISQ
ncbi:kinase-like domain-containing protein [Rhizophagus diaphanus]|nr:kinase-like domain-containing protein [Rhizophagus diaphanus] [Rhizophagus sp. MUCL 43196]